VKLGIFFVNDSELFSYFVGMGQRESGKCG
jgi:hypothetical protein